MQRINYSVEWERKAQLEPVSSTVTHDRSKVKGTPMPSASQCHPCRSVSEASRQSWGSSQRRIYGKQAAVRCSPPPSKRQMTALIVGL
jgi:hypothetical protein